MPKDYQALLKRVPQFSEGGTAPTGPPAGGAAAPAGPPMGGAPGDPAQGGAPGDPSQGGGAGTPPLQADPAMAGAGSPNETVDQLESMAQQYKQNPSPELKDSIVQMVMQLFDGGGSDASGGAPPAGGGGAMPAGPGAGAPPAPTGGAGPAPAPAGPPAFRRGGVVKNTTTKPEQLPLLDIPTDKAPRKPRF
jgi:hypothetical protein